MDWVSIFEAILPHIPAKYAADAVSIATFAIAASNLALRFWKPPSKSTRWHIVYAVVTQIAQAKNWNANAYQSDAKSVMIPVGMSRAEAAEKLGLDPVSTRPDSKQPPAAVG